MTRSGMIPYSASSRVEREIDGEDSRLGDLGSAQIAFRRGDLLRVGGIDEDDVCAGDARGSGP